MASHNFDDGPEVALQHYPEVITPQPSQAYPAHPPPTSPSPSTNEVKDSFLSVPSASHHQQHAHYYNTVANQDGANHEAAKRVREGPFGCTMAVFWLSAVITVFSIAVIGLAAGTSLEANRARNAEKALARLPTNGTATSCTAAATSTSFASIDLGCSNLPDTVTGSRYTSFELLGQQIFTIHCNKDAQGGPLMALFVADFETCIDACSGYTKYATSTFNESNTNTTCGGVSFVPLWTAKANATAGGAPGNCYLKPSPQNDTGLPVPGIGTECHAATLDSS